MRFVVLTVVVFIATLTGCGGRESATPTPTKTAIVEVQPTATFMPEPLPTPTPIVISVPAADISIATPNATQVAQAWEAVPHVVSNTPQTINTGGVLITVGRIRLDDWPVALDAIPEMREFANGMDELRDATVFGSIAVTVTNSTTSKISVSPESGTIVVGNEQVTPHFWISDNVGGELFPGVVSDGTVRFWLKRTTWVEIAQGVEMLYEVGSPSDENYNSLADTPYLFRFQLTPE